MTEEKVNSLLQITGILFGVAGLVLIVSNFIWDSSETRLLAIGLFCNDIGLLCSTALRRNNKNK